MNYVRCDRNLKVLLYMGITCIMHTHVREYDRPEFVPLAPSLLLHERAHHQHWLVKQAVIVTLDSSIEDTKLEYSSTKQRPYKAK